MNAMAKSDIGRFQDGYRQLATNIARTLPSHISAERFERATMVAVQRNPDLLSKADRKSLFLSLQRAAADGLLPDGREGAIVLFGNQAQWMPMVAGLMKLARNSGEIASINAHVAYEGETFNVTLGDEEKIEHVRNLALADDAKPIACYAIARLKDGEVIREVMPWKQVMKVRDVSRAKNSGPWVQWTDEMAKKTAIRRLSKRLPLSTDRPEDSRLQSAIEAQDNIIEGSVDPIDAATEASGQAQLSQSSKLDALEGVTLDGEIVPVGGQSSLDGMSGGK